MTTLVEELPYAAAVATQYLPHTCSKCFKTNTIGFSDIHLSRCVACRVVYYCGKECQQADWKDHKAECRFLKQSKAVPSDDLRLICRMLTKSKKSSKVKAFNGRTYDSLFDATDCRLLPQPMDPSKIFRQSLADDGETMEKLDYMALVEEFRENLTEFMGSEVPDYDTVFKAFSKRTTNAFPILDADVGGFMQRGVGLYIGLSVHDHSCRPDCFVINQGAKLLLRSFDKDLEYSDKLTICYPSVRSLRTTELRRMILKPYYMFTCNCEECLDLELDEKRSSGRSGCCAKGWFSLDDPVCSECGEEVSEEKYDQLDEAMDELGKEIFSNDRRSPYENEHRLVNGWINLFQKHKEILSEFNTAPCRTLPCDLPLPTLPDESAGWPPPEGGETRLRRGSEGCESRLRRKPRGDASDGR